MRLHFALALVRNEAKGLALVYGAITELVHLHKANGLQMRPRLESATTYDEPQPGLVLALSHG